MILSPSGTLNSSPPDAINIVHDPMQNPGQTRIFYKVCQTQMTRSGFNPHTHTRAHTHTHTRTHTHAHTQYTHIQHTHTTHTQYTHNDTTHTHCIVICTQIFILTYYYIHFTRIEQNFGGKNFWRIVILKHWQKKVWRIQGLPAFS